MSLLSGTLTPLVTPFTGKDSESIDYDSLDSLIDWQIKEGVEGFIVLGTTGEAATLSHDEKLSIVDFVVKKTAGRLPIIVGTGSNNTKSVIEFSCAMQSFDIQGFLIVTPYYNKPTQAGLLTHFGKIADSVDLPIVLYNIPGRTAIPLEIKVIKVLARHPKIVGIKESSCSAKMLTDLGELSRNGFEVSAGDDYLVYLTLASGGCGVVSATANAFPAEMKAIVDSWRAGNRENSLQRQLDVRSIVNCMFAESNPSPVKEALRQKGVIKDSLPRLPLIKASVELSERISGLL